MIFLSSDNKAKLTLRSATQKYFMKYYVYCRLEIGVQSVYEDIARDTNRGHTVKAVCENFSLAKDAGYKV